MTFQLIDRPQSAVDTVFKVKHFSDSRVDTAVEFEYTKAQMHQLAHCGTEGGHLGLASGEQVFIHSLTRLMQTMLADIGSIAGLRKCFYITSGIA